VGGSKNIKHILNMLCTTRNLSAHYRSELQPHAG
jgi:hypothetical protein